MLLMDQLTFKWNAEKAVKNIKKHGVHFDDAVTAFKDESAFITYDPDHSEHEDRWLLVGMAYMTILVVAYHHDEETNTVRIISARKAKPKERKAYEERLR